MSDELVKPTPEQVADALESWCPCKATDDICQQHIACSHQAHGARFIREQADRIKALERQVTTLSEGWRISDEGRIESEAKLAAAVEALSDTLEILADDEGPEVDAARTTLAELKDQ